MNEVIFTGVLKSIQSVTYGKEEEEKHNRVIFKLETEERNAQSLLLKCFGSMGDELAAMQLQPGSCTMNAYLDFKVRSYGEKEYQDIYVWKLDIMMNDGRSYTITR